MNENEEYQEETQLSSEPLSSEEVKEKGWDGVSEPTPTKFTDYDDYIRAMVDWKVNQVSPASLSQGGDPKTVVGHAVAEGVAYALQRDRTEQAEI